MVVGKHIGRLANNLFQIAASLGYARKYGYEFGVDPASGLSEPYSAIHQVYPNLPKVPSYGGQRYHEHPNDHCRLHGCHFNECHFDYHPIPDLGPNVTLTGFFQSWKYFEGQEAEIRKVFGLPHWTEYEDYISIHVRRGDYVDHSGSFPPIDMNYLNQAIDRIGGRSEKYIVCSDDISWCRENLIGDCFEFSTRTVRQDMEIMASCKHHIIANSTFSWWTAFLGHNTARKVISPSCVRGNWFGSLSGVKRDVVDLLPSDWIQIKFR